MGSIVSSRLDYIYKNPEHKMSYAEIEHEIQHVKKREHVSSVVVVSSLVMAMIALAGVLGSGMLIVGALIAIAAVAASYAYCCRLAETGLRDHLMQRMSGSPQDSSNLDVVPAPKTEGASWLGFFSQAPAKTDS
jgi:hypothetical protein